MKEATFIFMGATGDLCKRKLIPALYKLVEKKAIEKFGLVGVSRSKNKIQDIINESKKFVKDSDPKIWAEIEKKSHFIQLDFNNPEEYQTFSDECSKFEKSIGLSEKRIFYLSTLPEHFQAIVKGLKKVKMTEHQGNWPKLVFEKPFGHDLKSAKEINDLILSHFKEKQVYLIDHYLGKELVSNISLLRFTNRIFEPLWDHNNIENVQIVLNEDLTVGRRGEFYDKYGVVRDMVQSHMFQLLSLIAMESPEELEGESVRDRKLDIFKKLRVDDVLLGQYSGFLNETGVKPDSKTPTFAALKVFVDNARWKGVPFFLKTGKALKETKSVIYIKFKPVDCLLSEACPSDTNYLIINLKTNEGFALVVNTKIPGKTAVEPAKLDFRIKNKYGPNTPEGYESLMEDILEENHHSFVKINSIEHCWKALEKTLSTPGVLHKYEKGSSGPEELSSWSKKNKMFWRS